MDIIFHIEYYVYAGEQVAINIVDAADGVTLHRHLMTTADNAHWTFDWNADTWTADAATISSPSSMPAPRCGASGPPSVIVSTCRDARRPR